MPETARTHQWHLRYAPRMGFLGEDVSVDQHLDVYADYGFTAFEYNALPKNHTLEECVSIRRKMNELRMEMGVFVVNNGGWQGDALVDAKFHAGFREDVRKAVEYHDAIKNRWATVTSGLSVDYMPLSRQTQNVIDGLKKAAEIVEGTGLTLVLEPLNVLVNHPGYHVVTSDHAVQIIDAVGSTHVKILFDIYHQQISEGNLINNIEKHWDRIGYFQAGDVPGRQEPYTGEINYGNVFKRIYEKGYEGIIGMEHGLSVPGREGLEKFFEAYRVADTWG
ncbi:MAG: TIM barrel protein [Acidobacteria bacterium]|nr:TIM barrel protein [Acidobacteriota bacterium]